MTADLVGRLRDCARAYPLDMFPPVTDEQRREHSELVSQAAAAMGRHFAPMFEEAAEEIERLRADAARYRFLRRKDAWKEHYMRKRGGVSAIFVSDGEMGHATDTDRLDAAIDAAMNQDVPPNPALSRPPTAPQERDKPSGSA